MRKLTVERSRLLHKTTGYVNSYRMPRLYLRHPDLPPSLTGWILVNDSYQPRFWVTIWTDCILAGVKHGTRGGHLAAVERLYQAVAEQTGTDQLDDIIAKADFEALESALKDRKLELFHTPERQLARSPHCRAMSNKSWNLGRDPKPNGRVSPPNSVEHPSIRKTKT
jgi:hypothetical protein